MNIHSCDDTMKAQASQSGPLLVEHSYFWDADGSHGDAVQSYEKSNNVTFRYNHLVGGRTSAFIMNQPPDPGYEFLVQNNWINGDGQSLSLFTAAVTGSQSSFWTISSAATSKGTARTTATDPVTGTTITIGTTSAPFHIQTCGSHNGRRCLSR